jgi:hypothetical protein
MDLDRAEQEIGSLRSLLQERDILIPREPGMEAEQDLEVTMFRPNPSSVPTRSYKRPTQSHWSG